MDVSKQVEELIYRVTVFAEQNKHEFATPEHLLYGLLSDKDFAAAFKHCGGNIEALKSDLEKFFEENVT